MTYENVFNLYSIHNFGVKDLSGKGRAAYGSAVRSNTTVLFFDWFRPYLFFIVFYGFNLYGLIVIVNYYFYAFDERVNIVSGNFECPISSGHTLYALPLVT